MTLKEYDNIVFDYGGVIVNLKENFTRDTLLSLGVPRLRMWWYRKRIKLLVREFINGLRPTEDIIDDLLEILGKNVNRQKLQPIIDSFTGELPESRLKRIKELRKTHRVFLLSNINDVLWKNAVKEMKALGYTPEELFDHTFLSYEMKVAKPDCHIYEKVIAESGIVPERTLFLEDRKENVEAACRLGIHGILVRTNHIEDYI